MPEYYHTPALILTALLLPAFVYLYRRFRDIRSLLWLSGFSFILVAMMLLYTGGPHGFAAQNNLWVTAAGETTILLASALFLTSLSPLAFRVGRLRVLYAVPFTLPLIVYSILFYGVWRGVTPPLPQFLVLPSLGALSCIAALLWGIQGRTIPAWLSLPVILLAGGVAFWGLFTLGPNWAFVFVYSADFFMTALLLVFVFRRISPGLVLGVLGFLCYALVATRAAPAIHGNPALDTHVLQVVVMAKVVAAMGMILLILEDQLALNKAAEARERRARRELEGYTRLILTRRRVEDFDRQGSEICETVAEHSRFSQVALLLHSAGRYRLAGAAGFDPPVIKALDELAARLPATSFLARGSAPSAIGDSHTVRLDLTPWLWPGDDLKRLGLTSILAVPMVNSSATEGALLLSGLRPLSDRDARLHPESLRMDDLLPIEMLAGRLQATRSQTMMFEKLIDSEKFGHLGQLAANVTQQLNNPLTVILGYASLLEDTAVLDPHDRKAVDSILTEARRMRATLESLSRIAQPQSNALTAVSVAELLSDLGELHRPEFLQRSIEFRVNLAPNLPRVLSSAQQLRQAVRHCLQFAMESVENSGASRGEPKTVRLEAASEGSVVQIMVAHSGPGFPNPEHAFDSYVPPQSGGPSVGLSLCATIMRDNNGRASALNFNPRGAAIVLELKGA